MWSTFWFIQIFVLFPSVRHVTGRDYCKYYHRRAEVDRSHYKDPEFEPIDDFNIETAVDQWLTNRSGALIRFGDIRDWDVLGVTYMRNLFKDATNFNDNIAAWDVSCVTTMHGLFWG